MAQLLSLLWVSVQKRVTSSFPLDRQKWVLVSSQRFVLLLALISKLCNCLYSVLSFFFLPQMGTEVSLQTQLFIQYSQTPALIANYLFQLLLSLVQDLEQLYDVWLKSQKTEKGDDTAAQANKENGKQIHMPTDYAEVTVSNHRRNSKFKCLFPSLRSVTHCCSYFLGASLDDTGYTK